MSIQLIQKYYAEVEKLIRYGGSRTVGVHQFAGKLRGGEREESGVIEVDTYTTLRGVPAEAWEYQLGTYSALGWILERYKEKKPRDPTICEKFNTHNFADYKEQVIDLLMRVCIVSVETMKIVREMPE